MKLPFEVTRYVVSWSKEIPFSFSALETVYADTEEEAVAKARENCQYGRGQVAILADSETPATFAVRYMNVYEGKSMKPRETNWRVWTAAKFVGGVDCDVK